MRVAVDAMGGDDYPGFLIEGSVDALVSYPDVIVSLVGRQNLVTEGIDQLSSGRSGDKTCAQNLVQVKDRLRVVDAGDVIEMDESPVRAIRAKKTSSIVVANRLCRENEVDAVISAGNTGAAMAASILYMGRLKGVSRPALTTLFPTKKGRVSILDLGANTDCKPEHLNQFGVLGSIYVSRVLGIENPRVGLLNIGEERSKGNELTEKAYNLLEKSNLNFIGNVEGRDIFEGTADVVVCDGFVGNVLLKFGESVFGFVTHSLKKSLKKSIWRMAGGYLLMPAFREMKQDMTFEDYGGAPLLGVDGITIICHGKSTPLAIRNAIRVARQLVLERMNEQIKRELMKETG
ncbi:phosphate acyltransferase PlsX [Candidatus Latescibacterota bacterium]